MPIFGTLIIILIIIVVIYFIIKLAKRASYKIDNTLQVEKREDDLIKKNDMHKKVINSKTKYIDVVKHEDEYEDEVNDYIYGSFLNNVIDDIIENEYDNDECLPIEDVPFPTDDDFIQESEQEYNYESYDD